MSDHARQENQQVEGAEASALPQLDHEKEKDLTRIGELDVEPSPQHAATDGKG